MENIDNRIQPQDDQGSLNNLGKKRKQTFVPLDEITNREGDSFGMSPYEFYSLKDEGKVDDFGVVLKKEDLEEAEMQKKIEKEEEESSPEAVDISTEEIGPILSTIKEDRNAGEKAKEVFNPKQRFGPRHLGESHKPGHLKTDRKTIRNINEEK